ncbi:MAG: YcaO-like family protein [Acidobacteriota bacterium]
MNAATALPPSIDGREPLIPAIEFSDSLMARPWDSVRIRLSELALSPPSGLGGRSLRVQPLLERPPASDRPAIHLFFDVNRLFLLQAGPAAPDAVDSFHRFARDGYPIQPLPRLEKALESRGHRFLYPLSTLDVLPLIWSELKDDGDLVQLDLRDATIERLRLPRHPLAGGTLASQQAESPGTPALEDRRVGPSLREGLPQNLDALLGASNVVRRRYTQRDRLSLPFTTAEVRWDLGARRESCYGKSLQMERSKTVAVCEALERFLIAFRPTRSEMIHGSYDSLRDRALDPRTLFFGRSEHCSQPGLRPYRDDAELYWTEAVPASGGEPVLVPAQEVWFNTYTIADESSFIRPTTNACALGNSFEEASLFAVLEAAERDAFLTAWYLRRSAKRIDPESIADRRFHEFRHRWQLAFPNYRAFLFDITTDMRLPSVMGVAVRQDDRGGVGPKTFFTCACSLSAEEACRSAFEDLAGFDPELTAARRRELRELFENQSQIRGPAQHFALFSQDEAFSALNFLDLESENHETSAGAMQAEALIPAADSYNLKELIETLDRHCSLQDVGVYLRDMTQPFAAERGLHCVKAITPGLYPMWFGYGGQRFRPTRRLRRLAREWRRDSSSPVGAEPGFNLELHPFS